MAVPLPQKQAGPVPVTIQGAPLHAAVSASEQFPPTDGIEGVGAEEVGLAVGNMVGNVVGLVVGDAVGEDGANVGATVGADGADVGVPVGS